jgi:hypothetical protein
MGELIFVLPQPIERTCSPTESANSDCDCGPDFYLNDPRFPPKLAAKKARMAKQKFPSELIALLDRDGACVAAVDQGPDGFSMKLVSENGSSTIAWSPDDERIARNDLLSGKIKAFYKFNTSRALACCHQPKFDQRSDWDPLLELNLQLTIKCSKQVSAVYVNEAIGNPSRLLRGHTPSRNQP